MSICYETLQKEVTTLLEDAVDARVGDPLIDGPTTQHLHTIFYATTQRLLMLDSMTEAGFNLFSDPAVARALQELSDVEPGNRLARCTREQLLGRLFARQMNIAVRSVAADLLPGIEYERDKRAAEQAHDSYADYLAEIMRGMS